MTNKLNLGGRIGGIATELANVSIESGNDLRLHLLLARFHNGQKAGYCFVWADKDGVPAEYYSKSRRGKREGKSALTDIHSLDQIRELFSKAAKNKEFCNAVEEHGCEGEIKRLKEWD